MLRIVWLFVFCLFFKYLAFCSVWSFRCRIGRSASGRISLGKTSRKCRESTRPPRLHDLIIPTFLYRVCGRTRSKNREDSRGQIYHTGHTLAAISSPKQSKDPIVRIHAFVEIMNVEIGDRRYHAGLFGSSRCGCVSSVASRWQKSPRGKYSEMRAHTYDITYFEARRHGGGGTTPRKRRCHLPERKKHKYMERDRRKESQTTIALVSRRIFEYQQLRGRATQIKVAMMIFSNFVGRSGGAERLIGERARTA